MSSVRTPGIYQRLDNQAARIHDGVESNQLSRGEARALWGEERGIRTQLRADRASGGVTPLERSQLNQELNQASANIHADRHNDVVSTRTPRLNGFLQHEADRIRAGVASGQLTGAEARQLRSDLRANRQQERLDKSQGFLTTDQRGELWKQAHETSRDIYQLRHNGVNKYTGAV